MTVGKPADTRSRRTPKRFDDFDQLDQHLAAVGFDTIRTELGRAVLEEAEALRPMGMRRPSRPPRHRISEAREHMLRLVNEFLGVPVALTWQDVLLFRPIRASAWGIADAVRRGKEKIHG
jgi:hypothetical protein